MLGFDRAEQEVDGEQARRDVAAGHIRRAAQRADQSIGIEKAGCHKGGTRLTKVGSPWVSGLQKLDGGLRLPQYLGIVGSAPQTEPVECPRIRGLSLFQLSTRRSH